MTKVNYFRVVLFCTSLRPCYVMLLLMMWLDFKLCSIILWKIECVHNFVRKTSTIVSVTESLRLYCFSLATWWKDLVLSWCDLYTRRR